MNQVTLNTVKEKNNEPKYYRSVGNIQTEPQREKRNANKEKEGKRYMGHCKLSHIIILLL